MILSAENITSKIEVSINPCIPAERFLIYKPVSDPTKYSTCKNVGKATAFTGGCKYLCETGKYKSVAIDVIIYQITLITEIHENKKFNFLRTDTR